jgi:hypothetical protein
VHIGCSATVADLAAIICHPVLDLLVLRRAGSRARVTHRLQLRVVDGWASAVAAHRYGQDRQCGEKAPRRDRDVRHPDARHMVVVPVRAGRADRGDDLLLIPQCGGKQSATQAPARGPSGARTRRTRVLFGTQLSRPRPGDTRSIEHRAKAICRR